ncbi:DUF2789 domain-containing protein [Rhodoferax sp.]|uniref:DUF2789 domain-containing protein n=1 Tax=Rhodoferax sp. TaxID=50421 RepID=UPI0025D49E6B|nr:DUF2789 domain-containing protein [Rhodoferax sp.]
MDTPTHSFHALFVQLGLPSDAPAIARFLAMNAPLPGNVLLPDAPFWSPAQATFLREALQQDSDWAEPVDQLSQALRAPKA